MKPNTLRMRKWRANNKERSRKYDREYKRQMKQIDPLGARFHNMRRSLVQHAKKLNLPYETQKTDLMELYQQQAGKCFYTGLEMKLQSDEARDLLVMSCDRVDSSKGYVPGNVVLCCWGVNVLKGQHTPTHFYNSLKMLFDGAVALGKIKQEPPVFTGGSGFVQG